MLAKPPKSHYLGTLSCKKLIECKWYELMDISGNQIYQIQNAGNVISRHRFFDTWKHERIGVHSSLCQSISRAMVHWCPNNGNLWGSLVIEMILFIWHIMVLMIKISYLCSTDLSMHHNSAQRSSIYNDKSSHRRQVIFPLLASISTILRMNMNVLFIRGILYS